MTHTCRFKHPLHREFLFKFRDVGIYRRVSIYIVQLTQSQQKNTNVQGVSIFFYLVFDHFCLLLHLIGLHIDHWSEIQNVTYQTKPQYLYYNMQINQKCLCLIVFISWRFSFGKTCLVYIWTFVSVKLPFLAKRLFLGTFLIGHTKFIIWDNINRSSDYETSVSSDQFGIWDVWFMTTERSTNCTWKCRVFYAVDCILYISNKSMFFQAIHTVHASSLPSYQYSSLVILPIHILQLPSVKTNEICIFEIVWLWL